MLYPSCILDLSPVSFLPSPRHHPPSISRVYWTAKQAGENLDGAGGGRANPVDNDDISCKGIQLLQMAMQAGGNLDGAGGGRAESVDSDNIFGNDTQLLQTTMQTDGSLDGVNGGRAGSVDTDDISGNGGSFVFRLKRKEPNITEALGMLDPLNSIIDCEILDGLDDLLNSSAANDDEVRRGKGRSR